MAKQEYKILEFHGGTNNKFDPRDIADNQNEFSQLSVRHPGRLVKEGGAKTLYDKTDLNGHTITDITASSGGYERGYGLFLFSHDYDMEGDEVDTEFICINDMNGIDIYDPNQSTEWQANKFLLGSRTATVKPEYYNVDGALRVCDSNFSTTDASIDTAADITKNDVTLTLDNGAGGNVTLASGAIIQIDQEIMYVPSGATGTSFTVIRGFANTKISTHANNTNVYYINIPKYFGHIKQDRLFECASSDSINTWVEDCQTPQPPNNTRKSDDVTGVLANSAGVQSLRIYDLIEGSTTNYPTESEKVIIEFEEGSGDVGIIKVEYLSGTTLKLTTSGRGSSPTASHQLKEGMQITITNVQTALDGVSGETDLSNLSGTYEVLTTPTATTFTIQNDNFSADMAEDATVGVDATYTATADGWGDYNDTIEGHVRVQVDESDLPGLQADGTFPIHITGQTGVNAYNGIHIATRKDANELTFPSSAHGSTSDVAGTTEIQQLLGIVRPEGSDAINADLKRKWNFAMSFTYDGPAQEVQESLLTMGHTIIPSDKNDGTANLLNEALDNSETGVDVDDGSVFTANKSVIMVDSEQMLVTGISTNTLTVTRGYNGSTKDTHSEDAQIYVITELSPTETVDWTNFVGVPSCVIKTVYNTGVDEKTWNARINGFKIYMKDVTEEDASKEWRLFSHVNFNKGTYTLFAAGDSELILEQPGTWASDGQICTISSGTDITIKPIDTYLSENLFTEDTIIDAQYKCAETVGRRTYIGNIRQGGRTYPDRMLRTPVNKFDTFPETNFIDVAVGDGDAIIALKSFGDRLLQFKKNKLYVINVSGESEVLESEYPNAGIGKPCEVVETNIGVAWINVFGLWFFDGQQVKNLTRHIEADGYGNATSIKHIGFDSKTNRLIFTGALNAGLLTPWYIYDLELQAYQAYAVGDLFAHSESGANYYTNIINNSDGNMILGFVDSATPTELNFYQWSNDPSQGQSFAETRLWKSKDIDLASPAVNKKIYKVYVTYKCTGHSGVKMKYATDGSGSFSDFSSSSSTNYDVESFSTNGTATGFKDTNGAWTVAELKPSSSINNIKSIQLSLDAIRIASGTAQAGSSTTIQLASPAASTTTNIYNDYNINIYGGSGRYNTKKITAYASDRTATVAEMTDNGYDAAAASSSKYILGAIASDFEINDITIIFRPKRVK